MFFSFILYIIIEQSYIIIINPILFFLSLKLQQDQNSKFDRINCYSSIQRCFHTSKTKVEDGL